ncbi:MAG: outer membrane receptor protein involved in Fe transport, partial [Bacteroidia bacterium]
NYLCDLNFQVLATDRTKLLVSINNLLNNTYLASSWPAGHRPGMPRFVQLGFKMYL